MRFYPTKEFPLGKECAAHKLFIVIEEFFSPILILLSFTLIPSQNSVCLAKQQNQENLII